MGEMDAPTKPPAGASPTVPIEGNPLLEDGSASDGVPSFSRISAEHFLPAYARALAEHEAEIAAIAADPAPPTFANTIAALELSGRALERVDNVFHVLAGAHTNDDLLEVERVMAPQIARHWNKVHTNAALFRRVHAVMQTADAASLDDEQKRVAERYDTSFRRSGAALDETAKKRLAEIM